MLQRPGVLFRFRPAMKVGLLINLDWTDIETGHSALVSAPRLRMAWTMRSDFVTSCSALPPITFVVLLLLIGQKSCLSSEMRDKLFAFLQLCVTFGKRSG